MAKPQKYKSLLDKSLAAAVSAIEIYNKPDFKYREETFAILMVNAWELLLKAKILKDSKNVMKSIYVPIKTTTKENQKIKRFFPKTNRSGNSVTIDIFSALERVSTNTVLKTNIELLVEIRDNAIHFTNGEKLFQKKVLEIGTASLRSFISIQKEWFNEDLSRYNFYLMPLSFFHSFEFESQSINSLEKQLKNLLSYIDKQEKKYPSDETQTHNIGLVLETRFVKSNVANALFVKYSDEPNAVPVRIEEEEILKTKYPLSYDKLTKQCSERYSDFKINSKFFATKKELENSPDYKYARVRYLDVNEKKGSKKMYYSTEVWNILDTKYTKSKI